MNELAPLLRDLFASPGPMIGEIVAINADQTSTVQYPDGSQQRVRGTSVAVGSPAFIQGGIVTGVAPALTVYDIEV